MARFTRGVPVPHAPFPAWLVVLVLLLLFLAASVASAQQTDGELRGSVRDPSMGSVPNAAVVVTNVNTGYTRGLNAITTLPGAWRVDASLMKSFLLGGDFRLQLRFETFNLFNHPNLNRPILELTDSNFGKIRNKNHDARRVQMGVRLTF